MAKPSIEVFDFTASPVTNIVITPPAKTWMVEVIAFGVGFSGSDFMLMTFGGITTSTYIRQHHSVASDDVFTSAAIQFASFTGTSGMAAHALIYGLQLEVPTVFLMRPIEVGDTAMSIEGGFQTGVTAHTTIEVKTDGGATMNAGHIYVIYHKRKADLIETVDLGASPATSHEFTGLTVHNSLVMVSTDLGFASGTQTEIHLSKDNGSTWDSGANDYQRGRLNRLSDVQGVAVRLLLPLGGTLTTGAFFAVIENMRVAAPTSLIEGASVATAESAPFHSSAFRTNTDTHNALRFQTVPSISMNAGKIFLYGGK